MMHFIETDVNVLGMYKQECERSEGETLQNRVQEMGVDYDEALAKAFNN